MSKRFRLLFSAVGGTLLCACQSWTLTVAQTRQVRAAQRRMQRKLVGGQKRPDEEWLVYMRRETRKAEAAAAKAGCTQWTQKFLMSKWHWAGRIARIDEHRWPELLTFPRTVSEEVPIRSRPVRPRRGRPMKRWADDIQQYCTTRNIGTWNDVAQNRLVWKASAECFADWCLQGLR